MGKVIDLNKYREKKSVERYNPNPEKFSTADFEKWVWSGSEEDKMGLLSKLLDVERSPCPLPLSEKEKEKVILHSLTNSSSGMSNYDQMCLIQWLDMAVLNYDIVCQAVNGAISIEWDDESKDILINIEPNSD